MNIYLLTVWITLYYPQHQNYFGILLFHSKLLYTLFILCSWYLFAVVRQVAMEV